MATMNNASKHTGLPHEQSSTRSRSSVASEFLNALSVSAALWSLLGLLSPSSMAQDAKVAAQQDSVTIVERGPDYRVVQTGTGGTYTELATGLHYLKDGQWLETQEQIQVAPDGSTAYAVQGPHQVTFSVNINSLPAMTMV